MRAAQPMAKIYAASFDGAVRDFIAVFHRFIQQGTTDELLVDVHDYSHVHEGPGVILVAHECIYATDLGEGRLGLSYKRRRGEALPVAEGLALAISRAARVCQELEAEVDGLRFDVSDVLVGFDDALNAPGGDETFVQLEGPLSGLAERLFGEQAQIEHVSEARGPFRARFTGSGGDLGDLVARATG